MKYRRTISFAILVAVFLLLPMMAPGAPPQNDASKTSSQHSMILTGTVSEKGAALLSTADQKLYHVLNSETLKHLEGQLVRLKARFLPGKGELYVEAVRAETPASDDTFRLGDAAFRR